MSTDDRRFERKDQILADFRAGMSPHDIAKARDLGVCAVRKALQRAGVGAGEIIARESAERALHGMIEKQRRDALPRVDRDPCPRCNIRRDIGCVHTASVLTSQRVRSHYHGASI